MDRLKIKRQKKFDEAKKLIGEPVEINCKNLINKKGVYLDQDTGKVVLIYTVLPKQAMWIKKARAACLTIKKTISKTSRASGIPTVDAIFGYKPSNSYRRVHCSSASMSKNEKPQHQALIEAGKQISKIYKKNLPNIYKAHKEKTGQVLKDWIIEDTPFTSGVMNKNNKLPYHIDRGNFDGVYSNMICFKRGVEGGNLHIPEYGASLEIKDRVLVMFDGQKLVHGVEPFKKKVRNGYRYTAVYYSLKSMWRCETFEKEMKKANQLKTKTLKNKR